MAIRLSRASGLWTAAATWGVVDATSYNNSESATTALTTSYQASAGSTTGAITVAGVALKLSVRTGTTGTLSVHLAIAGVEVVGTLVTINTADLPVAANADLNGGWIFFKFAAPVLLLAATSYTVEAKTSSASQVSLRCTSGTNWARALVTTTNGAPAAGDDLIVCGEYTGAGTSNSFTVTMDETATTDYGAGSNSLVLPAIAICSKGTLEFGGAASTAYYLKVSGHVIVYSGGTLNIGTSGNNMPSTSSAVLEFDCGTNVEFGLTIRNLGTWNGYGHEKFTTTFQSFLITDEAASQTVLGISDTTGWANGDQICIASTSRTWTQCEKRTISTVDSPTQVTVSAGLTNDHSGTSPTQAEVGNLTRNVKVRGIGTNAPSPTTTLQSYIDINAEAIVTLRYCEFYYLGSATTNKRSFDVKTTTGTFDMQYCSFYDGWITGSLGNFSSLTGTNITFSKNVVFNLNSTLLQIISANIIEGNLLMLSVNSHCISLLGVVTTISNNNIVGAGATGINFNYTGVGPTTFSGNTIHSCGNGLAFSGTRLGVFTNTTVWRTLSATGGIVFTTCSNLTFDTLAIFGCNTASIRMATNTHAVGMVFNSLVSNGDTTFATASGVEIRDAFEATFNDCDFSTVTGIKTSHTQDVNIAQLNSNAKLTFNNCKLGAATEVATQSNLSPDSYIGAQKLDQTAGNQKTWKREGTLVIDVIIFDVTPSLRVIPTNASEKLTSLGARGGWIVPVASGSALSASIKVRKSVAGDGATYNGNQPRLMIRKNYSLGVTSDTVVATATNAANGSFETISGTTPMATGDNGAFEFYVDADGTVGFVNVDTFQAA